MWFTGIDWADTHHDMMVLTEQGTPCLQLRVAHDVAGVETLIQALRKLTGPDHQQEMICVIETKTNLLVSALLAARFVVCCVNPKTVDRWHPASGAKSDLLDARTLAKVARSDWRDLTPLKVPEADLQELLLLVRDQQGLIREQTRLANQLRECLKAYSPMVFEAFSGDMTQKALLGFLAAYPTPQQARQASVQQLTQLFKQTRHPQAAACAQQVYQQAQQPALVADEGTVKAKARQAQALVQLLRALLEQVHVYHQAIAQLYQQQPEVELFESLPSAGERLGPRLLTELTIFDVHTTPVEVIQQIGGTAPVTKQSGKSRQVQQCKACTKSLRDSLYQFCLQSIKAVPWAKEAYHQKRKRGIKHAAALRALAMTWLRIIWAMRRDQKVYQDQTFLQAQARHRLTAA